MGDWFILYLSLLKAISFHRCFTEKKKKTPVLSSSRSLPQLAFSALQFFLCFAVFCHFCFRFFLWLCDSFQDEKQKNSFFENVYPTNPKYKRFQMIKNKIKKKVEKKLERGRDTATVVQFRIYDLSLVFRSSFSFRLLVNMFALVDHIFENTDRTQFLLQFWILTYSTSAITCQVVFLFLLHCLRIHSHQ